MIFKAFKPVKSRTTKQCENMTCQYIIPPFKRFYTVEAVAINPETLEYDEPEEHIQNVLLCSRCALNLMPASETLH